MSSCSWWAAMPVLYAVSVATGLWAVYIIAIIDEKIAPLGSTNSMAGNFPPASCIFSEVTNLAGFAEAILASYRFFQVKPRIKEVWLNISALVAICISCFGMTLAANFQHSVEPTVHLIGAMLMFVMETVACWLQTYVTIKINLKNEGMKMGSIRALLSGVITTCLVAYLVHDSQDHYMSAAQWEWALVMLLLLFHGTFAVEFRHSHFETVCTDACPSTGASSCRPDQR